MLSCQLLSGLSPYAQSVHTQSTWLNDQSDRYTPRKETAPIMVQSNEELKSGWTFFMRMLAQKQDFMSSLKTTFNEGKFPFTFVFKI